MLVKKGMFTTTECTVRKAFSHIHGSSPEKIFKSIGVHN